MTEQEKILVDARRMMKKESWIRNVMKVYDKTREEAEALHQKIIEDELIRLPMEQPPVPKEESGGTDRVHPTNE